MRYSYLIVVSIVGMAIFSCKKKKSPTPIPAPIVYANFLPDSMGNYWVYQEFKLDLSGNATPTNVFDSTYIAKDTVISEQIYTQYVTIKSTNPNHKEYSFLRRIDDRIEDNTNTIVFTTGNFSTPTFSKILVGGPDTMGQYIHQMADKDSVITVPAGSFVTSNMQYQFHFTPSFSSYGSLRILHHRYAEQIGLIQETLPFFSEQNYYIEKRLVRFQVK